MTEQMNTAIVICTRNRPERLNSTLEAISRFAPRTFDLLVVDTSDEPNRAEVRRHVEAVGGRCLHREHRGLAVSRNAALATLTCDIVAFLDDDCVPESDWLTRLVAAFTDESIWAVTGRIVSFETSLLFDAVASQDLGLEKRVFGPDNIAFSLSDLLGNFAKVFHGQLRSTAPAPYGIGHGGNVAFRRERLEQLGRFNEAFWRASEDIEMFYRVLRAGGRIIYEPAAVAVHWHPHVTTEAVCRARYAYSLGTAAFMRSNLNPRMLCLCLGRLAQLMVKHVQYRLSRQSALAEVYGADVKGFCRGLVFGNPSPPQVVSTL
jgi:cellulose synthase/poly-beta-1,6-N-acetylglucosamine synthase-like glycosyltransferase